MAGLLARLAEQAALRVATRAQGAVVKRFETADATAPGRAIVFVPEDAAQRRAFERMVQFGVFVLEGEGAERYWLDAKALPHFRKEELGRVLGAVAIAGFAAAAGLALGR